MAYTDQLARLQEGVEAWNKWRTNNRDVDIDLTGAVLNGIYLRNANLSGAILNKARLRKANLSGAYLMAADLKATDFFLADLSGVDMRSANLFGANLSGANLRGASLNRAKLFGVNLRAASLASADLTETDLRKANVSEVNFIGSTLRDAQVGDTIFGMSDLSETLGLEYVDHGSPSRISTDVFSLSKGDIPEKFLRGCGLSNWEIEQVKLYNPSLTNEEITNIQYKVYDLRASQALQISPLFISYSHTAGRFVDKIEDSLNKKGIRFWRDIHDMKSGRLERQIDIAIRQNPTVLLVLSEQSLSSDWVEHEVRAARELEKEIGRDVLCPVTLDDSWKSSRWPKRVMEQIMEYNILDFSEWQDDAKFEGMFRKLIDGLELFYQG
jgi:hypothetical protein